MEQATDRFFQEIRQSHTVYSYVDVLTPTNEEFRLVATGGDIQVDGTADIRRRANIKCIDEEGRIVPANAEDTLLPNTEIRPYRGVRYAKTPEHPDGETEVVPLGVFRISKVSVSDKIGGSPDIDIEAYDLSRTVIRDKFVDPYVIPATTDIVQVIRDILALTFPDLEWDVGGAQMFTTAPQLLDVGDDPWTKCRGLAASLGCELYFDVTGRVILAPPPDLAALPSPAFTYIEGNGCTMLDLSRVLSDEPGFNGVVVTGESPGDEKIPVRAVVWDNEPTSATYHLGPYGEVPMFITDQNVKTEQEATAMASSLLNAQLGYTSSLSLTTAVNPALEVGDVVEVKRERVNVAGLFVVDAFNVPLAGSGTQQMTVRQTRTVA